MAFHCESADFQIRCLPEEDIFGVDRKKLVDGSQVFRELRTVYHLCTNLTGMFVQGTCFLVVIPAPAKILA